MSSLALPHTFEIGKVVLVKGGLNIKFMGSVQLGLPLLNRRLHAAIGLLESELLATKDIFEHLDRGCFTSVPISPKPYKALLGVLANEADPHKGI